MEGTCGQILRLRRTMNYDTILETIRNEIAPYA